MPLLPPRVIGPLSECSSAVRVQGQITGSSVEIFADGGFGRVGGGTATWSNQIFILDPGVSLAAGANITATQALDAETSAESPEPVAVQAAPPVVGHVGFRSHLYECGECIWLDGMVPGATVEITVGGVVRGSGTAHDGTARFSLSPPTGSGEILQAQQTACGVEGLVTPGATPDAIPVPATGQRQLPPPTVVPPLKQCQRAVTVADVLEGSRVTLKRTIGPNITACFDARSLWLLGDPLELDETVTADQAFPNCDIDSLDSDPVIVENAEPVPVPTVVAPLCDGATTVTVSGLLPGSRVRILQDGTEIGIGEAPEQDTFGFPMDPPLTGGTIITAQQELCGIWSDESSGVVVDPRPASLPTPEIPEPLYECASVVHVKKLYPGVAVTLISELMGGPIGWQLVYGTEADVPVSPLLIAGDNIRAVQIGCGLTSEQSAAVPVQEIPQLRPPRVLPPLDDCMRTIPVVDVIPGARVDVYVNGVWRGSKSAGEANIVVPIFGRLQEDDQVSARQRICGEITGLGSPVSVSRNTTGYWEGPFDIPVFGVHGALIYKRTTRTWKVMLFSGGAEELNPPTGTADLRKSYLWDPETDTWSNQQFALTDATDQSDPFCTHHSFLPDGRLLVMGGADYGGPHATGITATWIFDPIAESWSRAGNMSQRRWYPTSVAMPDGKVLVFSGWDDPENVVQQIEIFDPSDGPGSWSPIPDAANKALEIYPSMHLIPTGAHAGRICYTGTRWAPSSNANSPWSATDTAVLDPITNTWSDIDTHIQQNRSEGTSVLLPLMLPDFESRLLVLGGGHRASDAMAETAEIINLNDPSPSWTSTPDMINKRTNVNAVLLPDGTVFVCGGHKLYKFDSDPGYVYKSTIYHPDTGVGSWIPTAIMTKPRQYHSVALLLPDGRVLTAGGYVRSPRENQRNMEIYSPPYLCRASRPEITSTPDDIFYGNNFTVGTLQAASSIGKVVLIRPSAVTHHTNAEQRLIELGKSVSGSNQLQVAAPGNSNLAPPGNYMVFILDGNSTPSVAKFVRLQQSGTSGSSGSRGLIGAIMALLRALLRMLRDFIIRIFRWFP